jgi:putative ABC transport system substrate-binding protein
MNKRIFWFALSTLLFAPCPSAQAQQPPKSALIGWLGLGGAGTGRELFLREFRKLGYVEGKNISIEYRYTDRIDRLPSLADELIRLKVDVIVMPATSAALAAKNATRTVPIVFFGVGDPVAAGLVDSLARPGGNITGFTIISSVLAGKRLELLKETSPKLSRVALLWNPHDPGSAQQWKESQLPARELGLQLYSLEIRKADEYEKAIEETTKLRNVGLSVTQSPLTASNGKRIADLAAKNRLPAIYPRRDYVESGGLISYGPDRDEPFRRAAWMVDKILKGTKPADIPVEQPTKFELIINLKTAKALGLTIPPIVLMRAQRVIK